MDIKELEKNKNMSYCIHKFCIIGKYSQNLLKISNKINNVLSTVY